MQSRTVFRKEKRKVHSETRNEIKSLATKNTISPTERAKKESTFEISHFPQEKLRRFFSAQEGKNGGGAGANAGQGGAGAVASWRWRLRQRRSGGAGASGASGATGAIGTRNGGGLSREDLAVSSPGLGAAAGSNLVKASIKYLSN